MRLDQFSELVASVERPVVLLEGTRNLDPNHEPLLVLLGEALCRRFPDAAFRSGDALGSDQAFARGVASIDSTRMHVVVPYHKKSHTHVLTYCVQDVSEHDRDNLAVETANATPANARLVAAGVVARPGRLRQKGLCLLRDTMKVVGSESLELTTAIAGLFYVNSEDPMRGGTGHTLRVCARAGIPTIHQTIWMNWSNDLSMVA